MDIPVEFWEDLHRHGLYGLTEPLPDGFHLVKIKAVKWGGKWIPAEEIEEVTL